MRSPEEIARQLLGSCLETGQWRPEQLSALVRAALDPDPRRALEASRALFGILVEGLNDLFEPSLCSVYARLFTRVIECVSGTACGADLLARYERIRAPRRFRSDPGRVRTVFVLSRVSLGADIAVTSVLLGGLKRRFPGARICLAGPRKCWELFASDPRILHVPVPYGRSASLRERLEAGPLLAGALAEPESIVVDPDSRLTQLGLLPVCPDDQYYFFESRAYGGSGSESLSELAGRWLAETFDVAGARAYIAPLPVAPSASRPYASVSLGVGGNQAKRFSGCFEADLVRTLVDHCGTVLIDRGGGGEEKERVEAAVRACGPGAFRCTRWEGPFAEFAAKIARSRLYVGYDSAGQHAAAVCNVPAIIIFKGYASRRTMARWSPPARDRLRVIDAGRAGAGEVLERIRAGLFEPWHDSVARRNIAAIQPAPWF